MDFNIDEYLNLLRAGDVDEIEEYLDKPVQNSEDMKEYEVEDLFCKQISADENLKDKLINALYSDEYDEDIKYDFMVRINSK